MKLSTGLRNAMLGGSGLSASLASGLLYIYSGTPPNAADDALSTTGTNTLLCTISVNSAGTALTFGTPSGAVVAKNPSEAWSGVNALAGTATFFRHQLPGDTGVASSVNPRIQGTIAVNGADLNLTNVTLALGATQTVDYYSISFPTA
jgi:hypothetical protein